MNANSTRADNKNWESIFDSMEETCEVHDGCNGERDVKPLQEWNIRACMKEVDDRYGGGNTSGRLDCWFKRSMKGSFLLNTSVILR